MRDHSTLVLGASENPERYSYLAVQRLRRHGYPVVALGRKPGRIGDVEILTGLPALKDIDTVTMYLNASNQVPYYNYIFSLHPRRIIFNPGAENEELAALAISRGIRAQEACTLVLLSTNQYV